MRNRHAHAKKAMAYTQRGMTLSFLCSKSGQNNATVETPAGSGLYGAIPRAGSITHQHLAAVINTLLTREPRPQARMVRLLDMGYGNGALIGHFLDSLPVLQPGYAFDIFGLDVSDAGQQDPGFEQNTLAYLSSAHPQSRWKDKFKLITSATKWPFPNESFDFVTSNQVMEHVQDYDFVFNEIARCLRPNGFAIHLFPVREVLYEGHAMMPFVHRIKDVNSRAYLMRFFGRLGFRGQYYREMKRRGWHNIGEFADVFSQVLQTDTHYMTVRDLVARGTCARLNTIFTYTKDFYIAKIRSLYGQRRYLYKDKGFLEKIALLICKRVSCVTVIQTRAA